jgi:hypothetical protein
MTSFRVVSQGDFDKLVQSFLDEGQDLSDATTEAMETLKEGGVCLENIWMCFNTTEQKLKCDSETRLSTIEKAALSGRAEDFVNATFAMGSLKQAIARGEGGEGLWTLLESRKIFVTLVRLLSCAKVISF